VYGIEYIRDLVRWSRKTVLESNPELLLKGRINIREGDGWLGDEQHQYFAAIHVGAAASEIPSGLVSQLDYGGRLVVPVADQKDKPNKGQSLWVVDRDFLTGEITKTKHIPVRFVPLVKASSLQSLQVLSVLPDGHSSRSSVSSVTSAVESPESL